MDGTAKIKIAGRKYIMDAGEMIIMPANEPHALRVIESFKMMLIMMKELLVDENNLSRIES